MKWLKGAKLPKAVCIACGSEIVGKPVIYETDGDFYHDGCPKEGGEGK